MRIKCKVSFAGCLLMAVLFTMTVQSTVFASEPETEGVIEEPGKGGLETEKFIVLPGTGGVIVELMEEPETGELEENPAVSLEKQEFEWLLDNPEVLPEKQGLEGLTEKPLAGALTEESETDGLTSAPVAEGLIEGLLPEGLFQEGSVFMELLTEESGEPLSEDSDIMTRDLLYDKATNKQFITITDRQGNTFYIVIDYDAPINEDEEQYKTYFLNPVDLSDLKALTEETEEEPAVCTCTERCVPGAINMSCPVCVATRTACTGKVPEPTVAASTSFTTEEPEEPEEPTDAKDMKPAILVTVLFILIGGGLAVYSKLKKKKQKPKGNSGLDAYEFGDDEDDDLWETEDAALEPAVGKFKPESEQTDDVNLKSEQTEDGAKPGSVQTEDDDFAQEGELY